MSDVESVLREIAYFSDLPAEEVRRLARTARLIALDAGEAVFYEGDVPEGVYCVRKGSVKAVRYSPDGRQLIVREFYPGETFNEVGALDPTENAATALAGKKETEVVLIPGAAIRELAGRYPELGRRMMEEMARKLRFAMGKMNSLALMDVKARLAAHLLENAGDSGVLEGVSHEELAARLGTVRQVLGRALRELHRLEVLEVKRGSIRVLDPGALQALLDG